MPTSDDLQAIARQMKSAQDAALHVEPFTTRMAGFDVAAAYEAADLIHRARLAEGARPVGRKLGFTNPDMWSRYGVREPIWAHVYEHTVVRLSDTHASCPLDRFVEPKIEPEIVFGFRAAPPADATPEQVLAVIDWIAHGFEVVQSHFPGWRFQAADTVVDWALHGTLLVGPPQPVAALGGDAVAALETFSVMLMRDDTEVETGRGVNVLGSPLKAIAHLLSVLARQPGAAPLQAGELVTTGTVTTAQPVLPGQVWRSEVQGIPLPGLTLRFTH